MPFKSDLEVRSVKNGEWELTRELNYTTKGGARVFVPKGFRTDLASIPSLLRPFISVNEEHRKAAVLHDYGYRNAGRYPGLYNAWTRGRVDVEFYYAMESSGVGRVKRTLMYHGVRLFGLKHWKSKK